MTTTVHQLFPTLEARATQAMADYASGKMTAIHAVIEYGKALLEGRKDRTDNQFGAWVAESKLNIGKPWDDARERSSAMKIAELSFGKLPKGISFDDCTNTTPSNIMKWYRDQVREPDDNDDKPEANKPSKRGGGSKKAATPKTDAAYDTIIAWLDSGKKISNQRTFADERREVASHTQFEKAFDRLNQERAAKTKVKANENAVLAKAEETFSGKSKLTIADAIRIHQTRLDKTFQAKLGEEVRRQIEAADAEMRKQNAKLRKENIAITQLLQQTTIFTQDQFKTILRCLHPDNSASPEVRARAFDLFKQKESRLVGKV